MARITLDICQCGALRRHHVGGSGACEASIEIPAHGECRCLRYSKASGRGNKYGARRTVVADGALTGGVTVSDSGLEAQRLRELLLLQSGGYISDLRYREAVQVEPPGCESITWRVDFRYVEGGTQIYEDAKSEATFGEGARIKAKLLCSRYPDAVLRISYREAGVIRVRDVRGVDRRRVAA